MNQVVSMFKESNNRMRKIMYSDFDLKQITAAQREFEGQIKLMNAVVNAFGIVSKNKRAMKGLEKMNLMDTTTAIDLMLGDVENDKVKCPINGIISRGECLDYSGDHPEECQDCETGKENKEILFDRSVARG